MRLEIGERVYEVIARSLNNDDRHIFNVCAEDRHQADREAKHWLYLNADNTNEWSLDIEEL